MGRSKVQSRNTPGYLEPPILAALGGRIGLDPCANATTVIRADCVVVLPPNRPPAHACDVIVGSGLDVDWAKHGTVFLNCPWEEMGRWLEYARAQAKRGATIALLAPLRPHREYWSFDGVTAVCFLKPLRCVGFDDALSIPCVVLFFGKAVGRFLRAFRSYGFVFRVASGAAPVEPWILCATKPSGMILDMAESRGHQTADDEASRVLLALLNVATEKGTNMMPMLYPALIRAGASEGFVAHLSEQLGRDVQADPATAAECPSTTSRLRALPQSKAPRAKRKTKSAPPGPVQLRRTRPTPAEPVSAGTTEIKAKRGAKRRTKSAPPGPVQLRRTRPTPAEPVSASKAKRGAKRRTKSAPPAPVQLRRAMVTPAELASESAARSKASKKAVKRTLPLARGTIQTRLLRVIRKMAPGEFVKSSEAAELLQLPDGRGPHRVTVGQWMKRFAAEGIVKRHGTGKATTFEKVA